MSSAVCRGLFLCVSVAVNTEKEIAMDAIRRRNASDCATDGVVRNGEDVGSIPQVGERRTLKYPDGTTRSILVSAVHFSPLGPKAFEVWDSKNRCYLFSIPSRAPLVCSPEVSVDNQGVRL